MASTVTTNIKVTGDASDAERALNGAGDAAGGMAREIDASARKSETAARKYGSVSDATDDLDSTSQRATSSLGALSSGFELAGAEKYAGGLQGAALATDFFSGVGEGTTLLLEKMQGTWIANTAAAAKHRVVTVAQTAATKAQTVAQRALNLAMRLNPIGLIITAVVALVAIFVVLYKRNEGFRKLVQKVGRAGRAAIGWIVDKVGDLVGWVKDKAPKAWNKLKKFTLTYIRVVTTPWRKLLGWIVDAAEWVGNKLPKAWDAIKRATRTYLNFVTRPWRWLLETARKIADWIGDKLPAGFRAVKRVGKNALDTLTSPLRKMYDWVRDIVNKIRDIDFPDPPGWLSDLAGGIGGILGRTSAPLSRTLAAPAAAGGNQPTILNQITIQGAVDPIATANQLERIVGDQARRYGVGGVVTSL